MMKPSWIERAREAGPEMFSGVLLQGVEEMKLNIGKTLDGYSKKDLPLMIFALRTVAAILENHPAMGPAGRALLQALQEHVVTVGPAFPGRFDDEA